MVITTKTTINITGVTNNQGKTTYTAVVLPNAAGTNSAPPSVSTNAAKAAAKAANATPKSIGPSLGVGGPPVPTGVLGGPPTGPPLGVGGPPVPKDVLGGPPTGPPLSVGDPSVPTGMVGAPGAATAAATPPGIPSNLRNSIAKGTTLRKTKQAEQVETLATNARSAAMQQIKSGVTLKKPGNTIKPNTATLAKSEAAYAAKKGITLPSATSISKNPLLEIASRRAGVTGDNNNSSSDWDNTTTTAHPPATKTTQPPARGGRRTKRRSSMRRKTRRGNKRSNGHKKSNRRH